MERSVLVFVFAMATTYAAIGRSGEEPPAVNPFGPRNQVRDDALPGCVELSDGSVFPGHVYLTRDTRLKIFDSALGREREVPLNVIQRIDCIIEKEWMEKEWRFKENANDEKVFTGRAYPSRLYIHAITLRDKREISGPLAGIVYVRQPGSEESKRFLLHKRDKGPLDTTLESLAYVRSVELGEKAMNAGLRRLEVKSKSAVPRAKPRDRP